MRGLRSAAISLGAIAAVTGSLGLTGCSGRKTADLGLIYDEAARNTVDTRPPVIVIPGILGTKLETSGDGTKVWGAFVRGAADADTPEGARLFALPMGEGVPLSDLRDDVVPTDVLDTVVVDIGILTGLEIGAYVDILKSLAVGQYRDETLGQVGAIDYDGLHYTCFQFGYDWRRDIAEQAAVLEQRILSAKDAARTGRSLAADTPLKVDVVAHSMGGMVLRYFLRYGSQPLPETGPIPEPTWAGARHVRNAVIIGTPNAGSVLALRQLSRGWDLNPLFPNYRPALVGTLPAVYQLMPRIRHAAIVDTDDEPVNIYDAAVWERYAWGLADPSQDRVLSWILPDVESAEDRRRIALDHLRKCLRQAERLHVALDRPASPPDGTRLLLFAGDSERTPLRYRVRDNGSLETIERGPGDGTVSRASALMDERVGGFWQPGLVSPIEWDRVQFVFADHLGLTAAPEFTDNMLYLLLEDPFE